MARWHNSCPRTNGTPSGTRVTPNPILSCHCSSCSLGILMAPHRCLFPHIRKKKKSVRIACGPLTELIPFDHISAMLSGEISLYRKFASKMYEGLVYTDVLLRRMHICKFLREVVYEGPNFVELTHSEGHPRGRQGVLSLKCISFPDHCNREHGHMVNGQIWPQ